MIITRTPFRVSLFGGGTDFPAWYREHGGLVVSAAINKYCYVNVRYLPPFFDYKYRIRYTQQEYVSTLDAIQHPSVRECIRYMGITEGLEVQHNSDVPAMSGLGSSSAFTVGLLQALYGLTGRISSNRRLATEAIEVEQEWIKECVGAQDQLAVACGGVNTITFGPGDQLDLSPLALSPITLATMESHLLLCFSGFQRNGPDMAADQQRNMPKHEAELEDIRQIAVRAVDAISRRPLDMPELGRLLDAQWQLKRRLSTLIATPAVDDIYETGMRAGAYGAKLLGAGGGGFMLFLAPPERHAAIREALAPLLFVPFRFEMGGSRIIYYAPSEPYASSFNAVADTSHLDAAAA
jgi:D-glycero-alpha-D-manno-heptose-7-phosphate kinase